MILELCTDSLEGAFMASKFNAQRIELCAALSVGGLSPTAALVKKCLAVQHIETHVMIRPREGNFYYSTLEKDLIVEELRQMAALKVHGVVVGALNPGNKLPESFVRTLAKEAHKHQMEITFHRAFDFCANPFEALELLIDAGFTRILTSGQKATAIDGKELIEALVKHAKGKIEIMAGSGVRASTAPELARCGVDALHFTSHKAMPQDKNMGFYYQPDEEKFLAIQKSLTDNEK